MLDSLSLQKTVFIVGVLVFLSHPALSYADWGDRYDHYDRHDRYYHYHDHPGYGMMIDVISDDYVPVVIGGVQYYYYDGLYYAPARRGYILVEPPVGAVVSVIPPEYRPMVINGVTYYTDGGVYYVRVHHHGYQVVSSPIVQVPAVVTQPVSVVQPSVVANLPPTVISAPSTTQNSAVTQVAVPVAQGLSDESITVNIPNSQGGYIPVIIKKSGKGYIGPQGEYYPEFPKVAQLKALYSK